ncbi:uncharacterized protein LOC141537605 isoform X1 [Cotesia typhae]|uniref:uncharacterized protein LOC141537605 isoform X1 n=1 Tax=Cotesia typhae TaxID=2053667 RepID=UPI003D693125
MNKNLIIFTRDQEQIVIPRNITKNWYTKKLMSAANDAPVELKEIDSTELNLILAWSAENDQETRELVDDDENYWPKQIKLTDVDKNHFWDIETNQLFEVIKAADYLQIPTLVEVTTQIMADRMSGKEPEELRLMLDEINHKNKHLVFELIKAANYLNIPDLYRAGCRFIAMTIKEKKTAEGIRQYLEFSMPSPSHLAVVKYNNKWCENL